MTLPDDSSPKSSNLRPRRGQSTPKNFSEDNIGQRLQDANSQMQEQTEKLAQTINEHWSEGSDYVAPAATPTSVEATEVTVVSADNETSAANTDAKDQTVVPADTLAPESAVVAAKPDGWYGQQDTLNTSLVTHPRFIWPD